MLISGKLMRKFLEAGIWKTNTPIEELKFNANSIDVTLSNNFLLPNREVTCLDPLEPPEESLFKEVVSDGIILAPNTFCLASVNEAFDVDEPFYENAPIMEDKEGRYTQQPRYVVQHFDGRSTVARCGLMTHISAGFGDYGFKGSFTLEIVNLSPWEIVLHKGMRIGQVYFETVDEMSNSYLKYQGYDQTDCKPAPPRLGAGRF